MSHKGSLLHIPCHRSITSRLSRVVSRYVLVGILRAPRLTCLIHSVPKCLCILSKDNKNYQVSETMDRRGPEARGGDSTCTFLIMHSSSAQMGKLHCSGKHSPSSRMRVGWLRIAMRNTQ